tara:strand:+ start:144 stop:410 length:267 start_codon:yes stop_codon:yes gene_type:complete
MGGPVYATIYGPLTLLKTKWSDHVRQEKANKKAAKEKMNCWFCHTELIWGCDYSYDDYGLEGDGIIATFSCPKCESYVEAYSPEKTDG